MAQPLSLAVFASGGGTNLQALLDRFRAGGSEAARVRLLLASRAGIGAIDRARRADVPALVLDPAQPAEARAGWMLDALDRHGVDLVVLAGYVKQVPAAVVQRFAGRMINIHPALLPAFGGHGMYGARVHAAVLESGARLSGATVHLVDEEYDRGRILAQWPVPVLPGDTPETLARRVLAVEHLLLPAVVEALATGERRGGGGEAEWAFALVPPVPDPDADAAAQAAVRAAVAAQVHAATAAGGGR